MKKMIPLTLALTMSIGLVGCGSSSPDTGTDSAATTAPANTEAQTATEAQDTTQAPATTDVQAAAETEASEDTGTLTEAEVAFSEKEIPVVRDTLDSTETAGARVYEDLPNVPYMSVTDFYNQFYLESTDLSEGMSFVRDGNIYTVTNFCGDTAVFDVDADTIVIDDMTRFVKLACDLQPNESEEGLDPDYQYAQLSHSVDPQKAVPRTLSLADYSIDLRGDDSGVYAPLPTLADIFASASGFLALYSGEKIYVIDNIGLYMDSAMQDDPDYYTDVKKDCPEDMVKYAYNELCFNLDLWHGMPGQEFIHDDLMKGTFDQVLTEKYPEIKEMLLASDFETYYAGLMHLFNGLLFDGGHAAMDCDALMAEELELSKQIMADVKEKDYGQSYLFKSLKAVREEQREEFRGLVYNGDIYAEKGDTAIISLESEFVVDFDGWKDFYAGKGNRPFEGDTVGTILTGLERAAKNPEIKNIIIDDSCNGGGNDVSMLAIEWLMTGKGYVRDKDKLTGQFNTKTEVFDLNHDGRIDDSDVSPYTEYNYGVLTSVESFSCGNAFPWFMHEHGAMILGQKSSGGACAIRPTSARGIGVRNSCASSCTVNDAGETVDNGCPVDIDLTTDGDNPYENFYNLDILSEKMNEFFKDAE
jgi:hypothetical protein